MDREDWNRRYAGRELVWTAAANRFLVAEVESLRPGRALDIACGEGRNDVWLAERGWTVDAVDFSEVALDKARSLADTRRVKVNWTAGDLESWRPEERAYDLVIVFYLQLSWPAMRMAIRDAASAVAPGGTFLLVGHDRTNLDRGHGGPKSPDVLYTPDQIAAELEGLEVIDASRRDRPVDTDDGTATAIDCLVRAVRPA